MKKIFLVEDDAEICDIINEYFGNKGVEVVAVENGGEALVRRAGCIADNTLTCGSIPVLCAALRTERR